jgi:lysophospholipase L1-like esterase
MKYRDIRAVVFPTVSLALFLLFLSPVKLLSQSPDPGRFSESIEAFRTWDEKNSFPEDAVLFVGSSSIRMWKSAAAFPQYPVINRGFGGAHISDVLYYIEDVVLKYEPGVIVFYAGDNDIAGDKTPERVLADYRMFVKSVHNKMPDTEIIYVPIKPSIKRWQKWPEMLKANRRISEFCDSNAKLHFADIITPMLETGNPPSAAVFLDDGLHLSGTGYEIWNKTVGELLQKVLKQ